MGHPTFARRDFLKLLAVASASLALQPITRGIPLGSRTTGEADAPGVIIIVLDTLSASNMSLYGYRRLTTPNVERFASRSNVYHAHYSTANFTSSGTASLLTGTLPWTHRAFHYEGVVSEETVPSNLFRYWEGPTLAYTQNSWADFLLYQFSTWLDEHIDIRTYNLDRKPFHTALFSRDPIAAHKSIDSLALELEPGYSAASISALIRKIRLYSGKRAWDESRHDEYPLGVPKTLNDIDSYFLLEDVFDGLMELVAGLPSSALAYLHLFPPHYPHAPRMEFMEKFDDGWRPAEKPLAYLCAAETARTMEVTMNDLNTYDAYIATVDDEFGRLFDFMQSEGILERNYVVLTSDHGEIHERGVIGHTNEYLYEPLVKIPLVISSPGQSSRVDVHTPTSSVDVVPTLLALTSRPVPTECEGVLLPGLGGEEDAGRAIFSIDTKSSHVRGPIRTATVALRKGQYKLIAYLGYEGFVDGFELFDLENDPEEMTNLTSTQPALFADLRAELNAKLREVNVRYEKA